MFYINHLSFLQTTPLPIFFIRFPQMCSLFSYTLTVIQGFEYVRHCTMIEGTEGSRWQSSCAMDARLPMGVTDNTPRRQIHMVISYGNSALKNIKWEEYSRRRWRRNIRHLGQRRSPWGDLQTETQVIRRKQPCSLAGRDPWRQLEIKRRETPEWAHHVWGTKGRQQWAAGSEN